MTKKFHEEQLHCLELGHHYIKKDMLAGGAVWSIDIVTVFYTTKSKTLRADEEMGVYARDNFTGLGRTSFLPICQLLDSGCR